MSEGLVPLIYPAVRIVTVHCVLGTDVRGAGTSDIPSCLYCDSTLCTFWVLMSDGLVPLIYPAVCIVTVHCVLGTDVRGAGTSDIPSCMYCDSTLCAFWVADLCTA